MTVNCSICLNIFREPICLPCGHIYCSKCLSDHINAPSNKGMTAPCPECRTNFNIFTPELACLPRQYHQFILPSVRRVYLDLSAYSTLQKKLEQAEANLKVHKSHEEALVKRCESLAAALNAHRVGESQAHYQIKAIETEMEACIADHQLDMEDHAERYQRLEQEHKLLQGKYTRVKARCQELNEHVLVHAVHAAEESHVNRPGPSTPSKRLAMETRATKPLPKRRVSRRTRSGSPPPVYGNHLKRPRLSEGSGNP